MQSGGLGTQLFFVTLQQRPSHECSLYLQPLYRGSVIIPFENCLKARRLCTNAWKIEGQFYWFNGCKWQLCKSHFLQYLHVHSLGSSFPWTCSQSDELQTSHQVYQFPYQKQQLPLQPGKKKKIKKSSRYQTTICLNET